MINIKELNKPLSIHQAIELINQLGYTASKAIVNDMDRLVVQSRECYPNSYGHPKVVIVYSHMSKWLTIKSPKIILEKSFKDGFERIHTKR